MSYGDTSSPEIMINGAGDGCHCLERISSTKRKLDDYAIEEEDFFHLVAVRMRKDDPDAFDSSAAPSLFCDPCDTHFSSGVADDQGIVGGSPNHTSDSIPVDTAQFPFAIAPENGDFDDIGAGQSLGSIENRTGLSSAIDQCVESETQYVDACRGLPERLGWSFLSEDEPEIENNSVLHGSKDAVEEQATSKTESQSAYIPQSVNEFPGKFDLNQALEETEMELCEASLDGVSNSGASTDSTIAMEDRSRLHFFVRMMSGGRTLVLHADPSDTIESVHEQIRVLTGIPLGEQRLIYAGKQLSLECSLEECRIQNDAGLQLVGRMRSTEYPQSWQLINDLLSSIYRLHAGESTADDSYLLMQESVAIRVREFLEMASKTGISTAGHLRVFQLAGAPSALVMLYLSPVKGNRQCAENAIRLFLSSNTEFLIEKTHDHCAPILLEFCKLLGKTARGDSLYTSCRHALALLLKKWGVAHGIEYFDHATASTMIQELFPFVRDLSSGLSTCLEFTTGSSLGSIDVHDFAAFLLPLRKAIEERIGIEGLLSINHTKGTSLWIGFEDEIEFLQDIVMDLLLKLDHCLKKMEDSSSSSGMVEASGCFSCLVIMKELNGVSKLYENVREKFCSVLRSRRSSLNALVKHVKRDDDHLWLLDHKDVTDFDSKRHLLLMLFPDVKDEYGGVHEMLIDRSQLLAESFEYIAHADRDALHGGLFMEFKDEEATGPGVLREWFCLVCRAIFNPQNPLFISCPNDRRRFFPNPASRVDPMHLDYFGFCGRLIALALLHKVQIDVVFARVFFLQLAGKSISLEDVWDADPWMYSSCKKILELDADLLDSDALGLTFIREIEELGSRRVVELCRGGKDTAVTSSNRDRYVDLLIQHCFVTSVSEQVAHFAKGFADMLEKPELGRFFFQNLELRDLDLMLHGSDKAICVKDWKAHTEYNGYQETDSQIRWFWQVVESMSAEQHNMLLFFWTSIYYLPAEGFGGLPSKLHIYKALESNSCLPTSHTCFYRLCFPPYPSMATMRDSLFTITQEHISCSFGTW